MNCNCPHCSSENTISVPLAYAQGKGSSWGIATFGKTWGIGAAFSSTQLADAIAPPTALKKNWVLATRFLERKMGHWLSNTRMSIAMLVGVFGLCRLLYDCYLHDFSDIGWGALLIIIGVLWTLAEMWGQKNGEPSIHPHDKQQYEEYMRDKALWDKSWICLKCGYRFVP